MASSGLGRLMVPWSSRRARPAGVWRSGGRGLSLLDMDVEDAEGPRGWRVALGVMAIVHMKLSAGGR